MRSDKQKQTSRVNGSKSRGPVTAQGKANSAKNAATHNLSGDHFTLLSNENAEHFLIHENEYLKRFQPVDGVEYDQVQKMIVASWRQRRISCMETALFEIEMARQTVAVDHEFAHVDPSARQVLALFGTTDASAASALLLRYAGSARRDFITAFRTLKELQGDRFQRRPGTISAPDSIPSPSQQAEPLETAPPAATEAPPSAPAAARVVVVLREDRTASLAFHSENSKIQNEPKAIAAGQYFPSIDPDIPYSDAA